MKEYKLPLESFVGGYMAPAELCDEIMDYFHNNKDKQYTGTVAHFEVKPEIKESTDIMLWPHDLFPPFNKYRKHLQNCVEAYQKKYTAVKQYVNFNVAKPYLIQHYPKGGGFKVIHYERDSLHTSRRQLVYMLYCNTLKKGGTHFPFQEKTLTAKKGKLVIWPSDFTHPHVGVISKTQEKYIVTGWFDIV